MSHFTVLVIGNNAEKQLAPFQENNMGDCPESYMTFHDRETECLEEYETKTRTMVVNPEGGYWDTFDNRFRVKGSFGIGSSTYKVPDNYEKKEVPMKELYATFDEFMKEYHGYNERDEKTGKYGYWENPNAKWDWYELGGRWTGFFKVKRQKLNLLGTDKIFDSFMGFTSSEMENFVEMYKKEPKKFFKLVSKYDGKAEDIVIKVKQIAEYVDEMFITPAHKKGRPGLMTKSAKDGYGDSLMKKHIDIEGMRNEAEQKAAEQYDKVIKIIGHLPVNETWESLVEKVKNETMTIEDAREFYRNQPRIKALRESDDKDMVWVEADDFLISREQYLTNARNSALSTFAVIKDGKWYEKGEMGWWAIVSNAKEQSDWDAEFSKLFDEASDDTLFSIYDCHI